MPYTHFEPENEEGPGFIAGVFLALTGSVMIWTAVIWWLVS